MSFESYSGNSFFRSTQMLKQIKFSTNPLKQPISEPQAKEEAKEELDIELALTKFREAKAGIYRNEENNEAVNDEQANKPALSFVEQSNSA